MLSYSVFAVTLLTLSVGCGEKIDSAEEYVMQGQLRQERGQFSKAAESYSKAVELAPDEPTVWYDRGVLYGELNKLEAALSDYTKAVTLDPKYAVAYNNRAAIHARMGNYELAIKDCAEAIRLDPTDSLAFRNRGLAYHDLDQFAPAIDDYTRAIELNDQDARTYLYRGNVMMDLARFKDAEADIDRAIVLDSSFAEAWVSRSILSARLGQGDRSEAELIKAKRLGAETTNVDLSAYAKRSTGAVEEAVFAKLKELGYETSSESRNVARLGKSFSVVTKHLEEDGTVSFSDKELESVRLADHTILAVTDAAGEIVRLVEDWSPNPAQLRPTQFAVEVPEEAKPEVETAPGIPMAGGSP